MNNPALLRSIDVKGLFGSFDYHIDLPDSSETLILTAPNGYGKTTLLSIISAISNGDLFYFLTIPFREINLEYEQEIKVNITSHYIFAEDKFTVDELTAENRNVKRQPSPISSKKTGRIIFSISTPIGSDSIEFNDDNLKNTIRRLGYYRRLELKNFDVRSEEYYQFLQEHAEAIYSIIGREKSNFVFLFYLEMLAKTNFIQSQRLFVRDNGKEWASHINLISQKLKNVLEYYQKRYLIASQQMDARFISRVLESKESITRDKYDEIKKEIEGKINKLRKHRLIGDIVVADFNEKHAGMLGCYISDLRDKLSVFDEILSKITLFMNLVEKKHFTNKTIEVSLEGGLRARSNNDNSFVLLDKLSSGEKNELILLYELIFNLEDNCMLLIDEPEISLHVSWQLSFMKELRQIAKLKNLSVIVATHSPQIINSDWKSCFDLYAATRK